MAAKRKTTTKTVVVRAPAARAAAPIIKVSAPRAPAKHKRRRHVGGGGRSSGGTQDMIGAAIGGAIFGYIEKSFQNLPTLPIVGRAGTVAIACYFLRKQGGMGHGKLVRDVGMAAAVIAGYQLGKTGQIAGEGISTTGDVDGDLAAQI